MKIVLIVLVFSIICAANVAAGQAGGSFPSQTRLEQMASRFTPTPLRIDISGLSAGDRHALTKLIEAARIFDRVYLQQMWSGNVALYQKLQKDTSALGRARLHYFLINKGPWSEIDEYKAFLPGVPAHKPPGANFYPEDVNKAQLETWFSALPQDEQQKAKGFFTVIRWKAEESG